MRQFYITLLFLIISLISFGQSIEVGVTEGQLSVSLSGAATYTIPIAVPSGINGIVPQISLTYNSQSGNGMAGYGWNIGGISTISRIPATKFHDNVIDAVDFNALDRFALDGQRLIVKNGTNGAYGADKTIYETESFSNIKITSFGVHSSGVNYGPAYFLVEYPDGSKAYYGNSVDSRSVTDWAITYWENPQGVRISYNYSASDNSFNNVLNIISIKYGSIATATPINEIRFKYNDRKRAEQSYVGGLSIISNTILKEINVLGNGLGFRNYVLDQETTSLNYQRLKSITEKSGDNTKSYNPTIFSYDDTSSSTPLKANIEATLGWSGINNVNTDYISGDFDNDGKTDIILYSKIAGLKDKYTLFSNIVSGKLNAGQQDYAGTFENIFPAAFLSSDNKLLLQGWAIVKRTDANCIISLHGSGSTSATTKHYEKQYNFSKTVTKASNWSYCDPKDYKGVVLENIPIDYYSGDFNGDGLTDVIGIEKSFYYDMTVCNFGNRTTEYQRPLYQGGTVHLFNLDRRLTADQPDNIGNIAMSVGSGTKIYIADFNGDGKSDIYVLESGFIKVYTLNKDNKLTLLYQNTSADSGIALDRPILIGDYNGDGKIDFIIPNELDKDSWNFYFSMGNNFKKINASIGIKYLTAKEGAYMITGSDGVTRYPYGLIETTYIANDYNGDGKTDILCQNNVTVSRDGALGKVGTPLESMLILFENQSVNGEEVRFSRITSEIEVTGIGRNPIPVFTNHNQVNQNLEYSIIYDNMIKSFKSPKDNREDVLLKGITNGNKVKETITYKPLKQDPYEPIYSPTSPIEIFPNFDIVIAPGFKIVSMLEKQSKAVYKKQKYSYLGAVSNMEGIGFLGFRSTSKTNWYENDSQIISTISKNDISLRGANTENYTYLGLVSPSIALNNVAPNVPRESQITVNNKRTATETLLATNNITFSPGAIIKPEAGNTFIAKITSDYDANGYTETNTSPPYHLISKSLSFYETSLSPSKVFKLQNVRSNNYDIISDSSNETNTVYDNFSNPLESITKIRSGGVNQQVTTSVIAYEPAINSPYMVGRPKSKTQNVTAFGDSMNSKETYQYGSGSESNLLKVIQKWGNNTNAITETNGYDTFGNIIIKTISAPGVTDRKTSFVYYPTGILLKESTDIEGFKTAFEYYPNGTLKSESRQTELGVWSNALLTGYEYDSWFRKTVVTDYLGKTHTYAYIRESENAKITLIGNSDGTYNEELFDELGRKIRTGIKDIQGTMSYKDFKYDIYDRNFSASEPNTGSPLWNTTVYDVYGRPETIKDYKGKVLTIKYDKRTTTITDGSTGQIKVSTKNAMGNVLTLLESPIGGTINYSYFANGNLKETNYNGNKISIIQDGWGRKISLTDPSAGTYTYGYNELGESTKETTPNGTTTYKLNDWGKIETKTITDNNTNSTTQYTYMPDSKLLVKTVYTDDGDKGKTIITDYTYDSKKRLETTTETTGYGAVFTKKLEYDAWGRVEKETKTASLNGKTSSSATQNEYKNGFAYRVYEIKNGQKTKTLWETTEVNAQGQLTKATLGNGIAINNIYDSYGYVTNTKHTLGMTTIMELGTNFDTQRGNLKWRKNSLFGNVTENFDYDTQDRLIQYPNVQGIQENQAYEDDGRIKSNTLGTYNYGNSNKKYQNTSIALTASTLSDYQNKPLQTVSYNTFKSPVEIVEDGKDKISFVYNDNNHRSVMFYGGLGLKETRTYRKHYSADGSMEVKENTQTGAIEFVTYIGGDGYSAPVVYKKSYSNIGTTQEQTLYLHRDYQGSILAITNETGVIVEKRQFDAWGAIVKVQDGAGNILNGLTILDRGYTGHEHLQSVGLLHMNGRLYDPKLHRFLQPDNYIQALNNTQNYNRYGYVLNNPLKYTDYSGEKFKLTFSDIVAGIATVVGAVMVAVAPVTFGTTAIVGAGLLAGGLGHFAAAYSEYSKTGDWVAASNNAGLLFGVKFNTDWGYGDSKDKQNGIIQNEPVVKLKSDNGEVKSNGEDGFSNEFNYDRFYLDIKNTFNENINLISNTLSSASAYVTLLEDYSKTNAQYIYKYGTKSLSSLELTAVNAASQLKYASVAKSIGTKLSIAGVLLSAYQYYDNQITGLELSADIGFTALGFWGGEYGAAASIIYFIGKPIYNSYHPNNPLFPTPKK